MHSQRDRVGGDAGVLFLAGAGLLIGLAFTFLGVEPARTASGGLPLFGSSINAGSGAPHRGRWPQKRAAGHC